MKKLIGYVWKISEVNGDADEIVNAADMLLMTVELNRDASPPSKYKIYAKSPSESPEIGATLSKCDNWQCEVVPDHDGEDRHLLRGNVELRGHTCEESKNPGGEPVSGTHFHHIVMVYPDPMRKESLSGYILSDEHSGTRAAEVLEVIREKYGKKEIEFFLHDGTYHSEN